MKNKIKLNEREQELLNRAENLFNRKKITRTIIAGNYKKTKEELLKNNPSLQKLIKKLK